MKTRFETEAQGNMEMAYWSFLPSFFPSSFLPSFFIRFSLPSFNFFFQGSGEQSQELYTFHEAVSQLQDAEDKLMDDDRNNIEVSLLNLFSQSKQTCPIQSRSRHVWDWIWKCPYLNHSDV